MAVIETPPETVTAAAEAPIESRTEPTGFAAVLGSGDHKVVGRLYLGSSLLFAVLLLALGVAVGVERISRDTYDVFSAETATQALSMLRFGLIFQVALPLVIGLALVVVPLQVGARAVAFPRAAAASFWAWLLGAVLTVASYLINGGPGGGRTAGVNLWISSLGLTVIAVLLAAVCLATTVLALRQPNMSTNTVPMFSWSVLVAATLWILTLPVLLGLLAFAYIGHGHGNIGPGNNATMDQFFNWVLRNPQVYIVAIPVLGLAADVIANTVKARIAPRAAAAGAVGAFGVFSFGAFLAGSPAHDHLAWVVIALGLAAVLPVLATLGLVGDLFRRGKVAINGAALYAVAALLVLVLTVIAGALASIPRLEIWGSTTDFAVANGAVIAAITAALGGITWWATKIGRQPANELPARLAPLLLLAGGAAVVIADVISALTGSDKELSGPGYTLGVGGLNAVVAIGFGLALLGVLIAITSFLPLLKSSDDNVPADPWEGQSLEWLAPSPPPVDNFVGVLPVVTSAEPLYDLREEK